MRYPHGRCEDCGERLYRQVDGGYICLNCGATYPESHFEDDPVAIRRRPSGDPRDE